MKQRYHKQQSNVKCVTALLTWTTHCSEAMYLGTLEAAAMAVAAEHHTTDENFLQSDAQENSVCWQWLSQQSQKKRENSQAKPKRYYCYFGIKRQALTHKHTHWQPTQQTWRLRYCRGRTDSEFGIGTLTAERILFARKKGTTVVPGADKSLFKLKISKTLRGNDTVSKSQQQNLNAK